MSDARELRKKAALCRRAAAIKTEGGARTDRRLLELADELEQEAAALERAAAASKKKPKS